MEQKLILTLAELRPNSLLMKTHLNSLEPEFYLDLHQIAHTH